MTMSRRIVLLGFVLFGLVSFAHAQTTGGSPVRKDAPAVVMSFPTANATVSTQLTPTIWLRVNVSDPDEALWGVAFFICVASGSSCVSPPTAAVGIAYSSPYQVAWVPPPPIIYQQSAPTSTPYLVWAIAANSLGQERTSAVVPFTLLQPPSQPRVTLIVPNAAFPNLTLEFVTPAAPVFYATALPDNTIPPSTIVRVEFLDGADVIGTVATPNALPSGYAFTWSNAPSGAHLISARAVDSYGDWTVSAAVPVYIVGPDVPPTVAMTAPTSGQIFTRSSSVPLSATASSSQGWIERVDFTAGTTVIASVFSPPFTSNWVNPPQGHFTITATAYDDLGLATTSPAAYIQVLAAPRLPAVVLTAPAPGTTIAAGVTLPLAAAALAPDGSISRVDFLSGSSVIGSAASAPYAYTWTNPTVGSLSLKAKAYDTQGNSSTSTAVGVTVIGNSPPPTVTLVSPSGGTSYPAPGTVAMSANATPASGASIVKVEFLSNGSVVGTRTMPPYSYTWSNVAIGNYSVTARATDNLGAVGSSSAASVSVVNDAPPTVSLTAPSNGQTFYVGQPIGFAATASDSDGTVSKVEFLVDGAVIASTGSSPYAYTWTGAGAGTHTISARATDNLGAATTSSSATITVAANNPPTVSLTAPANGQAFTFGQAITLTATASDTDGTIAKVEFMADGVVVGTITASPYTVSWTGAALGTHTLAARATDNRGAPTTSAAITIRVTPSSTPTISLAMPSVNKVFAAGATVNLAATAADSGGTIVRVEFYAGATLIGTVTTPPYNFAWTNVSAGNYVLTAKVIDNQTSAVSTGVPIQVVASALTITSPAANASIAAAFTLVMGTYQGPLNSGVTVNGVVANNDGQGHYFINNFPLAAGANTLTVTLNTADGQTVTQTQTVTSTGRAPMQVYTSPDAGFPPSSFTIKLLNRSANTIAHISYANLGGGQLDGSNVDQTTLGTITYSAQGVYTPQFIITDSAGNTYTLTETILVQDKVALDRMLKGIFNEMSAALRAGDQATALKSFIGSAQAKYGAVFAVLAPWMPSILDSMSPIGQSSLGQEVAEYALKRVIDGKTKIYFVYFVQDADGVWRLDSM
jgi:hypothetical protein